jgi:hypothetical protein
MVALAPAVRPSQNACCSAARPSALLVRMRARISQTAWISCTFMVSDGSAQQRRRREGRHEDIGRLVQERVPAAQRQPELADRCRRAAACACRTDAMHHGAHGRWMGSRDKPLVPVTPSLRTLPRRSVEAGLGIWASAGRSFGAGRRALARFLPGCLVLHRLHRCEPARATCPLRVPQLCGSEEPAAVTCSLRLKSRRCA